MRKIITTSANGKYSDRAIQLFGENTKRVAQSKMKYGINYISVKSIDLINNKEDSSGENKLKTYKVRVNDVYSDTQSGKRKDGYKLIVFENPKINYIQEGTKFYFYNSTWIADNPSNYTKVLGQTLVRQCIATRNTLDYYGNVVREPFAIDRELSSTNGNSSSYIDSISGNLSCLMQKNENTKDIKNNDRILMGGQAFQIVGLDNYTQEFTDEIDSVRKLKFNLKMIEPTENDDIENNIVDGKINQWKIKPNVKSIETKIGASSIFSATVTRDRKKPTMPYNLCYESYDDGIITISNESGEYTAIKDGETKIKCYLKENPKIFTEIPVVVNLLDIYEVRFESQIGSIIQYSTEKIVAYLYKNGIREESTIDFEINGDTGYYSFSKNGGNRIDITCLVPNEKSPIEVFAKKNIDGKTYISSQKIWLENI